MYTHETSPPLIKSVAGSYVVIAACLSLLCSITVLCVLIYSILRKNQKFGLDNWAFILAVIAAIPQSVLVGCAVGQGLGSHIGELTASSLTQYYKMIYASQLLGIFVESLAKLSALLFILRLDPQATPAAVQRMFIIRWGIGGLIILWAVFSIFTLAFQCGIPRPWEFTVSKCVLNGRLYYVIISLDMVIDALLAFPLLPVIWALQMKRSLRIRVMCLLAARIIVWGPSIGWLIALGPYLNSTDKTWYNTLPTILYQMVIALSITTSGVPSIQRFFEEFQTGHLGVELSRKDHQLELTALSSARNRSTVRTLNLDPKLSRGGTPKPQGTSTHDPEDLTQADGKDLCLTPQNDTELSTHISASPYRRRFWDFRSKDKGENEIAEDSSITELKPNEVRQTHEVVQTSEWDGPPGIYDGESAHS